MSFGEHKKDPAGTCRCPVDISGSLIWRVANLDGESPAHGYACPLRERIFQTPLHHPGCCGNDLRTPNQIKRELSQLSPGMQIGMRDGCWNVLKSQYRSLIHPLVLHRWGPWKGLIEFHSFYPEQFCSLFDSVNCQQLWFVTLLVCDAQHAVVCGSSFLLINEFIIILSFAQICVLATNLRIIFIVSNY